MCNINIARKEGGNSLVCAGYDDGSIQVFRCVLLLLFVFLFVVVIFAVAFVFIICCGCFALFCFSLFYSFLLTVMNLFLFYFRYPAYSVSIDTFRSSFHARGPVLAVFTAGRPDEKSKIIVTVGTVDGVLAVWKLEA